MKNFEYAQPQTEREAVQLLSDTSVSSAVLAGGTDLISLMKRMVVTPDRVVDIAEIESLKHITSDADGNVWIGAGVHLDEVAAHRRTSGLNAALQVIDGISSIQLQAQGTLVGELLRRPTCWYFRDGHGLLAGQGRMVVEGDNRYHAILGARGPAKFVHASRLAPALIALGASVRVIGPDDFERFVPLHELYQTPKSDAELEHTLQPGQLVTHVVVPTQHGWQSAAYEVRHGEGPDQPLTAAAVNLRLSAGRISEARIILGQVAPTPWIVLEAAQNLVGLAIDERTAAIAGHESVAGAVALSHNEYKIQLAAVAVKRALLRAVGQDTGGLDRPFTSENAQVTATSVA